MSDQPLLSRGAPAQQAMGGSARQAVPLAHDQAPTQYTTDSPAQYDMQQHRPSLQSVGDSAIKQGYSETSGFDAGQGDDRSGFRANRPNTPEVTDTASRVASKDQEGTAHLTGSSDGIKGSWLTQLVGEATYNSKQRLVQLLGGHTHMHQLRLVLLSCLIAVHVIRWKPLLC